jgi:hypothetical protein
MNVNDYLIDQADVDWAVLLRAWTPPLPRLFTLWMVNRFGDAFVVHEDNSVHMLDVGAGTYQRLADSRGHFADLMDVDDNANNWLMVSLVDACCAAGMIPRHKQCYGFKVPPILGGEYEFGNVELTDIAVHFSFLGDIYKQTKDLPDGTVVRTVISK